ncbi:type II CAAX prenyl endopeptidase Rce1 family protein [Carboxylicivirga sp. M1479]|uniref:CPBP family glutamic-type intramembrane protease n=1 Tax=Carboxylicivirga sp. M1479 TaxID=2594476 RepID=UPI001177B269|nr:CPBP family glutamic-type intramembrane protease [Carboxylicivirga sp. M1479]TRX72449.1 CPBP family intramembrane metalloprotease [Carboxylicivirga sp. M1479]
MKELIEFIKTGSYSRESVTIKGLFKLYLLHIAWCIPLSIPFIVLKFVDALPTHAFQNIEDPLKFMFGAVFIAPIVEELIFRWPLVPTRLNISIALSFFLTYGIKYTLGSAYGYELYLQSIPICILIYLVAPFICIAKQLPFKCLMHFLVIAFGFLHISNFTEVYWWMYLIFPVLTVPQIVLGYVCSFARMKYGVVYSIILHAFNNLVVCIPLLIKYLH